MMTREVWRMCLRIVKAAIRPTVDSQEVRTDVECVDRPATTATLREDQETESEADFLLWSPYDQSRERYRDFLALCTKAQQKGLLTILLKRIRERGRTAVSVARAR